jgi:predicted RND superfamily exporter protein
MQRLELRADETTRSPDGDPAVERTAEDRRAFFENDEIIVLLTARSGAPSVASPQGLRRLRQVHDALRTVLGVESERVRSLANVLDPQPGTPLIAVPQALDTLPDGDDDCRTLIGRLRGNPFVPGLFLSGDGRTAALYAPLAVTGDRGQVFDRVERRLAPLRTAEFDLRATGPVAVAAVRGRIVFADLVRLTAIIAGVVAGLYLLWLRSVRGTIIPLATITIVVLCTFGGMGWSHTPVTPVTPILPIVLIAFPANLLWRLLDRARSILAAGGETVEQALGRAVHDAGPAMTLTFITSAVCFLSLLSAPFPALRGFGVSATFAIFLSLLLSFTMVPALVQVLPGSWLGIRDVRGPARKPSLSLVGRRGARLGDGGILVGGALLLVAIPGLFRLEVQDAWAGDLDPASDVMSAQRAYDAAFWGARRFDVVITSAQTTFFQRVEGIRIVENVERVARTAPHVQGVISHVMAHEILAGVFGETGPISRLPPDQVLWYSNLLQKVQRRIDLDHYLRRDGAAARVRLFLKDADRARTGDVSAWLEAAIPGILEGTRVSYYFSGELPSAEAAPRAIVPTLVRWFGWTVIGVGLALALGFRSVRMAWIGLAPPLGALAILFGGMGYSALSLGVATCAIAAVAFAAALDPCLRFLSDHRQARDRLYGHARAPQEGARSAERGADGERASPRGRVTTPAGRPGRAAGLTPAGRSSVMAERGATPGRSSNSSSASDRSGPSCW